MRNLFWIDANDAERISHYHVALLLVSLPYDRFYSHLILISLVIHTLIHLEKKNMKPVFTINNLLLQSVFYVTLFGVLYSVNQKEAFNEIGRQSTLFLIPIIFCLNPLDLQKYKYKFLTIFAISSTTAVLFLYCKAFYTIQYYQFSLSTLFSPAFINHNFAKPIEMHATFFSMQIALSLIFFLSEIVKKNSPGIRLFQVFCCCILFAGIIQLSSKSVSIALFLIILFALPYFAFKGFRRTRFIVISISFLALAAIGIYQMKNIRERYTHQMKMDLSEASEGELTDPRLARWEVALKLAAEAPILGHGSGSEIMLLKERFFERKFYRSFLYGLNAHNQFISLLIKSGLFGLMVYLITLFWGFKTALARKDLLLFSFMVIITAVSFSENYLDVDKGIFFYGVFFSLLVDPTPAKLSRSINVEKLEVSHV
jgi:O-antigen ligase